MARTKDVATFSSTTFKATVEKMKEKREAVHDKGEEVYRRTGRMDPLVSVQGCAVRKSKFAYRRNDDNTFTLVNGYKRPYMFSTDGTGSFGAYIEAAFHAAPKIYTTLESNARGNHQMDFSFSVFQDRDDRHDVIQVPEFESDNRFAEHMRLLVPDKSGGDSPEDYDLGIWYAANMVEADVFRYGGKGFFVLLLDAPGRGRVESHLVKTRIGCDMQTVSTSEVWKQLQTKFHSFVVVFSTSGVTDWWRSHLGKSSVITAPSHDVFAEVQSGLVYAIDDPQPTEEGLYDFLRAGQGSTITRGESRRIWNAYKEANVPFGANAKMKVELPKPGDIFANMHDKWPIGHPLAHENVKFLPASSSDDSTPPSTPSKPSTPINWDRF